MGDGAWHLKLETSECKLTSRRRFRLNQAREREEHLRRGSIGSGLGEAENVDAKGADKEVKGGVEMTSAR